MALYPLYGGVLHIIYVVLGLSVVIVHLCLLYIGSRYFHLRKHCILSCLGCTIQCVRRFLRQTKIVFIYIIRYWVIDYSLLVYFCSFYAIYGTWFHKNLLFVACQCFPSPVNLFKMGRVSYVLTKTWITLKFMTWISYVLRLFVFYFIHVWEAE